jgi:hypothetical protein
MLGVRGHKPMMKEGWCADGGGIEPGLRRGALEG